MKNSIQKGDYLEWSNGTGSDVASGDVVPLQHCVGVAVTDIPDGESGTLQIEGVVEVPKVSAAVFAQGEKLIWDADAGAFDDSSASPATGDLTGAAIAAEAGANGETTCKVKLTPGNADRA
jgi:predicted RecA/RadA family phage recombinase